MRGWRTLIQWWVAQDKGMWTLVLVAVAVLILFTMIESAMTKPMF